MISVLKRILWRIKGKLVILDGFVIQDDNIYCIKNKKLHCETGPAFIALLSTSPVEGECVVEHYYLDGKPFSDVESWEKEVLIRKLGGIK